MIRSQVPAAVAALAAVLLISCLAAAPAQASYVEDGGRVWLLDDGGDNLAATDWRFSVSLPDAWTVEDDSWTIPVYGQMVNSTGSAATGTYTIAAYVDDGIINRSAVGTVLVSKTAIAYGNITFSQPTIDLFSENRSATLTLQLKQASTVLDSYVTTVPIYGSSSGGASAMMIGIVGTLFVVGVVVAVFTPMLGGGRK